MRWLWFLLLGIVGVAVLFLLGVFGLEALTKSGRANVNDYAASPSRRRWRHSWSPWRSFPGRIP